MPETPPQKPSRATSRAPIGPWALAASGIAIGGVVLAVVASFATVIQIQVLTVVPDGGRFSGLDRYGPALLILAGFATLMIVGAIRGSRPAMYAVALTGVAILLISLLVDVPHIHDTGVWPKNDLYEDAQATPGPGFYMETAAGVLLLLGGVLMVLAASRPPRVQTTPAERRAERATATEPEEDDEGAAARNAEARRERERHRTGGAPVGERSDTAVGGENDTRGGFDGPRVAEEPEAPRPAERAMPSWATRPEPAAEPDASDAAAEAPPSRLASDTLPELPPELPPEPSQAARFSEPGKSKRRSGGLVDRFGLRKR